MKYNYFNGTIPTSLSKLSKLTDLILSSNFLNGTIPTSLGKLSKLTYLYPSSNSLSDTIPTYLGKLSKLTYLDLSSNSLSGTIPTFLSNLIKLTQLDLSNNQISGTYTLSFIDKITNIQRLYLSRNILTIKLNVTYIPNFQLDITALGSFNIEGYFPSFILTQYSLLSLDLSQNSLSGNIPNWL